MHWRESCPVLIAKLVWVTSIGQVSNAVVGAGLLRPFSYIKVEWMLALSNTLEAKEDASISLDCRKVQFSQRNWYYLKRAYVSSPVRTCTEWANPPHRFIKFPCIFPQRSIFEELEAQICNLSEIMSCICCMIWSYNWTALLGGLRMSFKKRLQG